MTSTGLDQQLIAAATRSDSGAFSATAVLAGIGAGLALLLPGRRRGAAREQAELEPSPAPGAD